MKSSMADSIETRTSARRSEADVLSEEQSSEIDFLFIPSTSRNLHRGTVAASLAILGFDCVDVEEVGAEARGAVAIVSFDPCPASMQGRRLIRSKDSVPPFGRRSGTCGKASY